MAKTIEDLFYFAHFSINLLLAFFFFLYFRRTKKELPLVLVTTYVLLESILNLFTEEISRQIYSYVWSSFTMFEYCIFSLIIFSSIKRSVVKKAILYLSIGFIIFTFVYNLITNFTHFDSIPIGVETILILLFSFYYLYEQMNDTSQLFVYSKYQFWLVIGFMLYLAGSFFVFIFAIQLSSALLNQYWIFTNAFYMLMIVFFIIALFLYIKGYSKLPKSKHFILT